MQTDSSATCPVCERYIGPVQTCPYCSSKNVQSPVIRAIRIVALVLATFGLFLLFMTARHREPPVVIIEKISPAMNFAHVRIAGKLKRKPYISQDRDYISFRIYGATNSIQVVAHHKTARELIENSKLPAAGDCVSVRGNLSVSAKSKHKLYLKIPDHLTIDKDKPEL